MSLAVLGQQDFLKFVNHYYRVDPFEGKFSAFIKALSTDKQLLRKKYTNESERMYNFSGSYNVFNPFSVNANQIEMQFQSDKEEIYFGVPTPMYVYTLTARFDDNQFTRKK
ncbi:hypothetical protein [Niabella ginsengisoli]|uniref:Uncharacterized protein n=1 Tax=Niabella ginsengisoli TaxID=522298 RepID=A0ABS9SQM4_9BACT|nr:hypothetical protein [Niabella ginsengisoli]MCH5600698.1 hypothetical protein [Niabella ginsengisoli]